MGSPSTPRPMRADARRNYERIIAVAREAFAEHGPEAPLDDIARRAEVGPGTLYRHFPNREALIEAVYRDDILRLTDQAHELAAEHPPTEALTMWVRAHVAFAQHRRGIATTLKAAMDKDSETFALCKTLLYDAATDLISRAQEAGEVRSDIEPRDLLLMTHGIVVASENAPGSDERMLRVMLAGLRAT